MPNYIRENWSADLDFGTGEWSVGAWVNVPVTPPAGTFPTIGNELLPQTFTSGWSFGGTWTESGGILSHNGVTQDYLTVPGVLEVGAVYKIQITVTSYSGGSAGLNSAQWSPSTANTESVGVFTYYRIAKQTAFAFWGGSTSVLSISNISCKKVLPAAIADRSHTSGARLNIGVDYFGFLTATAFDGTTTRTVTTTAAYNTATWLKAEADYTTDGSLSISVNGQEVAVTRGTPLLPLFGRKNLYNFSNDLSSNTWLQVASIGKTVLNVADPFGGTKAIELSWPSQFGALEQTNLLYLLNGQQYKIGRAHV
jgi:hypothetical protein